jgi:hypothetical protein
LVFLLMPVLLSLAPGASTSSKARKADFNYGSYQIPYSLT